MNAISSFAIDLPTQLIADAQHGSMAAFERIYRLFERPVYTLALRLLGDREEAQEVLHDSMLKVLQHIGSFRGESPFWGWLRQIAVNQALMRLRRREPVVYVDELPETGSADDAQSLPPAAADSGVLLAALQQLAPITRSVLWLYHVEGHTHEEIATLMNKSTSFSKSQLARGSRRLRELLEVNQHATT